MRGAQSAGASRSRCSKCWPLNAGTIILGGLSAGARSPESLACAGAVGRGCRSAGSSCTEVLGVLAWRRMII